MQAVIPAHPHQADTTRTLRPMALRALLDGDEDTWQFLLRYAEKIEQEQALCER